MLERGVMPEISVIMGVYNAVSYTHLMLEHPFTENQETEFKSYLESIGDSIVVVADDEIVKVHVHTNDPVSYTHLCSK